MYLAQLGEFSEAILRSEEGVQIAEDAGQPYSRVFAYLFAGEVHLSRGDFPRAILRLDQGWQVGREWLLNLGRWSGVSLALANARLGRHAEALSLVAQVANWKAVTLSRSSPAPARLAETYLLVGNLADATPLAEGALVRSRDRKEQGLEAHALRLLGEIAAHRDPPEVETAEAHYQQALALASELGMRPLVAHCHLGVGKLYRRTNDGARAQGHLTTATAMYHEMDMGFWLAKAEAEVAGVDR
jgi:tetratricopeptide (TPR) repeat protein